MWRQKLDDKSVFKKEKKVKTGTLVVSKPAKKCIQKLKHTHTDTHTHTVQDS